MEKRDLAIVLAGALLVAGATVYAGAGPTRDEQAYSVAFSTSAHPLSTAPIATQTGPATLRETFAIELDNVSAVQLRVDVTPTAATAPLNVHVTLTSPSGNATEADGAVGAGTAAASIPLSVLVAPAPAGVLVKAATAQDAEAKAGPVSTAARGTWIATISIAGATPLTPPYDVAVKADALVWSATMVTPAPGPSK